MPQLGLIRTGLLRYLRPDLSEESLAVVDELGSWALHAMQEYRKPDHFTIAKENELALRTFVLELRTVAAWFFEEFDEVRAVVPRTRSSPDEWLAGYYTDWGIRLQRHLTRLALHIEAGLTPPLGTLVSWWKAMPERIPAWNRGFSPLELPPPIRPAAVCAENFVTTEAKAETAVLADLLDVLRSRVCAVADAARESLGQSDTREVSDLYVGLEALEELLEAAVKQARCVVETDDAGDED